MSEAEAIYTKALPLGATIDVLCWADTGDITRAVITKADGTKTELSRGDLGALLDVLLCANEDEFREWMDPYFERKEAAAEAAYAQTVELPSEEMVNDWNIHNDHAQGNEEEP